MTTLTQQQDIENTRLLARTLSRPIFMALARGEEPQRIFKHLYDARVFTAQRTAREIFESAYNKLRSEYRNEYIYKTAIANKIVFGRHSPRTASISIELPVGKSIVDAAIFNGTSTAYEIKTAFDSPKRLATQTPDYLKAFDKVYIVTHPDFARNYIEHIDERVGILTLDKNDRIRTTRAAKENKENIDTRTIFRILRREEYVSALEKKLRTKINIPNGLISSYCEELFKKLSKGEAHRIFISSMRNRTIDEETVDFISALPMHLRVLGYSTPLSRPQRRKVLEALSL
ncbi:hypothetical protein D9M69_345050 [compost metagenome]